LAVSGYTSQISYNTRKIIKFKSKNRKKKKDFEKKKKTYRNKYGIEDYPNQIKTPTQAGYASGGNLYYDVVGYPAWAPR
jgi:hypothetical protein